MGALGKTTFPGVAHLERGIGETEYQSQLGGVEETKGRCARGKSWSRQLKASLQKGTQQIAGGQKKSKIKIG